MAKPLVPDELWEVVRPMLPKHRKRPGGRGRPPVDDRAALGGILFVLKTGIPCVGVPAAGDGLRQRDDLLAPPARLAPGRRVRAAAPQAAGRVAAGGATRLHRRHRRLRLGPRRARGKQRAKAPQTAGRTGPSTTCWSTPAAPRWPPRSPGPTATTLPSCCHCWTRPRRSPACGAGRGGGSCWSWATAPATPGRTARRCGPAAASRCWPAAARPTAAAWERCAGRWSGR